ncbi:unnamed protein product [Ectocarpus fasciculatus]
MLAEAVAEASPAGVETGSSKHARRMSGRGGRTADVPGSRGQRGGGGAWEHSGGREEGGGRRGGGPAGGHRVQPSSCWGRVRQPYRVHGASERVPARVREEGDGGGEEVQRLPLAAQLLPSHPGRIGAAAASIQVGGQQQPRLRGRAHEGPAAIHDQGGPAPHTEPALRVSGVPRGNPERPKSRQGSPTDQGPGQRQQQLHRMGRHVQPVHGGSGGHTRKPSPLLYPEHYPP